MSKKGTMDLTQGRPITQILLFSIPLVIGTLFQQLYSFADTVMVGRLIGEEALAAVGTTYSLNFLTLGFVQGACVGFGIPLAQAVGAKDEGISEIFLEWSLALSVYGGSDDGGYPLSGRSAPCSAQDAGGYFCRGLLLHPDHFPGNPGLHFI